MNNHTADRPTRISPVLRSDIQHLNETKFQGKLPFARASDVYVEEKRRLEESLLRLQKQIEGMKGRGGLV